MPVVVSEVVFCCILLGLLSKIREGRHVGHALFKSPKAQKYMGDTLDLAEISVKSMDLISVSNIISFQN